MSGGAMSFPNVGMTCSYRHELMSPDAPLRRDLAFRRLLNGPS
jgi:hypothetical protein